jgi:hypothetical protein
MGIIKRDTSPMERALSKELLAVLIITSKDVIKLMMLLMMQFQQVRRSKLKLLLMAKLQSRINKLNLLKRQSIDLSIAYMMVLFISHMGIIKRDTLLMDKELFKVKSEVSIITLKNDIIITTNIIITLLPMVNLLELKLLLLLLQESNQSQNQMCQLVKCQKQKLQKKQKLKLLSKLLKR